MKTTVEKTVAALHGATEAYEKKHPHWRIEVLVSLMRRALTGLRHYVEDVPDPEITWEQPFVELRYPVEWDWERRDEHGDPCGGHIFGQITKENTATKGKVIKTLTGIMANQFNAMALADFTQWAWLLKRGKRHTPVLPIETFAAINAIKGKRERREACEEFFEPLSFGAATIDYDGMDFRDGAKIPKKAARQLAKFSAQGIPDIRVSGEINGRKIAMSLVFQIHPMIADYDAREAYHRITVGLFIAPKIVGNEMVTQTPAEWPKKDRKALWDAILGEIGKLTDQLIPKPEIEDSVIISVNAQIKVPLSQWHPENRGSLIKKISDAQSALGELVGIGVTPGAGKAEPEARDECATCGLIHDGGFTRIKADDGEVIALAGVLPDIVRLIHKAHEKGLNGLCTKDDGLAKVCGGYRNPCKAFDDLKRRAEYKRLFDTRKRGFIALRGAIGRNRNQSESGPE